MYMGDCLERFSRRGEGERILRGEKDGSVIHKHI
jgi:hypothetical protein